MSHEGIRLVSAEQAKEEDRKQRELPRGMTDPAKVRVHKTEGTGLEIDWKDGHRSTWNFAWLRNACPCATCVEEREQQGRKPGDPKPQPKQLLQLYEPPPRPASAHPVGRYAIQFNWQDSHSSGIYSWDFLRRHCQCAVCQPDAA